MSGYSERPPREEAKNRSTDMARTFKKADTVHGRPPVTGHDMHEDLMNDPPKVCTTSHIISHELDLSSLVM